MTKQVQRRRGTASQHTSFTGAEGEISVNTTNKSVHVHDGVTAGGVEAARADLANVSDASLNTALAGNTLSSLTITSADINGGTIDGTVIGGTTPAAVTATSLTATGTTTLAGASTTADITFGDNDKAIFGAGSDLQIYHDGVDTYITESGAGSLIIKGNFLQLQSPQGEMFIDNVANGAVTLYYDNAAKLATTSTGVDVTGTVTADGLTVGGNIFFDSTSGALRFRTTEGVEKATARLATNDLKIETSGLARTLFAANGDISFYEDTGTTPKFFWDASAEALVLGDVGAGSLQLNHDGTYAYIQSYGSTPLRINKLGNNVLFCEDGGNVGIGTSSPTLPLDIVANSSANTLGLRTRGANDYSFLQFRSNDGTEDLGGPAIYRSAASTSNLLFYTANGSAAAERMRIDASGNVGIGTSSTDATHKLKIYDASSPRMNFQNSVTGTAASQGMEIGLNNSQQGFVWNYSNTPIYFATNNTERMRIDASGNLLVGKTSAAYNTDGFEARPNGETYVSRSGTPMAINRNSSDGTLLNFYKDGTTVGSIGSYSGSFLKIQSAGNQSGTLYGTSAYYPLKNDALSDGAIDLGEGSNRFKDLYLSGSAMASSFAGISDSNTGFNIDGVDVIRAITGGSERMRIDSSGDLLLGKTTSASTTAGMHLGANGKITTTRSSGPAAAFVRLTSDGSIVSFQKDGTTVGSIGTANVGDLYIGNDDTGVLFAGGSDFIIPWNPATPAARDAAISLGGSSHRFKDIYATNALIQTSDRNEKQDIAELDEAERRVAVAAKGLLRKFRWRDAVAEKGDDARIHFGIIAQDLQAAFAAEGLDAGKYAMFIHTTWTDEETGEERSRMGVRYSELLAFIIAAI